MYAFIDNMPFDNEFKYLILIKHITTKEISVVGVDKSDELDYLGCANLSTIPVNTCFSFVDDEGEEHEITILSKN